VIGATGCRITCRSTGAPTSCAAGYPPRFARRRPVNGGVGRHDASHLPEMHAMRTDGACRWNAKLVVRLLGFLALSTLSAHAAEPTPPLKAAMGVNYAVWASGLSEPRGLLLDPRGGMWVAEEEAGTVLKIGADGKKATIAEGLARPHDIAVDARGTLYVAETGMRRVATIAPGGKVSPYAEDLKAPVDLAFHPNGELLVCQFAGDRVLAFRSPTEQRTFIAGFKSHGLAFDKSGSTYINDLSNGRVVKVSADGAVEIVAADVGVAIGVAVGNAGDIYLALRRTGKLLQIRPDGSRRVLLEGLQAPRDPVIDAEGNLYLAETEAGRILKLPGRY